MKHLFTSLFLLLFFHSVSEAQVIGGIFNKYTKVSDIDTCAVTLKVKEPSLFKKGEKVFIIQMSGAIINEDNNDKFGQIQDLRQTGKYEVNEIDSIIGSLIYLKYKFVTEYFVAGAVQMVSFPSLDNVAVNDTLRAKPWDGETGGVVAFEGNAVTLNAPILVNGMGYRGGALKSYNQCDAFDNYNDYYYALNSTTVNNGGQKGEGVAAYITNRESGRGPQANGGGGGNNHKSGGAGGGHVGSGGQGGEQERANFLRCPGKNPGLGGLGLPLQTTTQLFMGGGGGSGHNKEATASAGSNGGGIVFIRAKTFEGNNKTINASGNDTPLSEGDGAGGGGAGGTILLDVKTFTGNLTLNVKGGKGGNSISITAYDFGPGGGGSGGRILLSNTSANVTTLITGGGAGINQSKQSSQNASKGADGIVTIAKDYPVPSTKDSIVRIASVISQPVAKLVCEGDTTTLTVKAEGPSLKYQWEVNTGTGYAPLVNSESYDGVTTPTLRIKKVTTALNPYLYRCVLKSNCQSITNVQTVGVSLIIKAVPIPIFSYVINKNTVTFNNGSSNGLSFKWSFGDGSSDTNRSPIHTYALQDTYRVVVVVKNECGTGTYNDLVNLNTPPFAGFTANGRDACPPSTIYFTNSSSDNVRRYFWSFPGATPDTSNAKDPAITYSTPGQYDVRLIVENGYGRDTFIRKNYVKINSVPVVDFTATKNGLNVNFINNTTNATNFSWDFGDGTKSSQVSPQYTYRTAGTYIVRLKASNACGSVNDSVQIIVYSLPSATINASQISGCTPMVVQYSGRNTTSVSTWNWSFPGGIPASSNLPNPRVTYTQPGKYDVLLTMTNSAGTNNIRQDSLIQVFVSPKASFNYKVTYDVVELFNTSKDANSYSWDFGDGSKSEDANPAPHRYARNGNYIITLLAQNASCSAATERQAALFFTGIKDVDTEGIVKAYPNPTSGKMYLEFQDGFLNTISSDVQLAIFNTNGQNLKNIKLNKEKLQEIDMSEVTSGVYILQFLNEKQSFVKRIVKM